MGFLSLASNMRKNIDKIITKNLSSKQCQNLIDHDKQSATDPLKTCSKRAIQKIAEETSDFIGNNIADYITKIQRASSQTSSETVSNKAENIGIAREITKVTYASRQKTKNY